MGGRNQTTTTTIKENRQPYGPSQPYLKDVLGEAQEQFNAGLGEGTTSAIANLRGLLADSTGGNTALASNALGGFISGAPNPYLSTILDTGADRIADRVKAAYSAKGRYGSEDFTDALTRGIGEYQTGLQAQVYDADKARQLQAIGMAPGLDQAGYLDADKLLQLGLLEDAARADALNQYAGITTGIAGSGGSSSGTQSTTQPGPTLFQRLLGGASAVGGLLGGLSQAGWGFPILGGLGLLSDERAKEDIERVGETDDGLGVYTYAYKGDPTHTTFMGVMAQEVAKKQPEAVRKRPDGFLSVEYSEVR